MELEEKSAGSRELNPLFTDCGCNTLQAHMQRNKNNKCTFLPANVVELYYFFSVGVLCL